MYSDKDELIVSIDINIIAFSGICEMRIANILEASIILYAHALFSCFHRTFRNPGHRSRSNRLSNSSILLAHYVITQKKMRIAS